MTRFFSQRDELFAQGHWQERFRFDASVAAVFDDMALRSIPLYRESLDAMGQWVRRQVRSHQVVYDLGCSTGSGLVACMAAVEPDFCRFVGVDTAPSMIERAQLKLESLYPNHSWSLLCADLLACDLAQAGGVVLSYALQFVPVAERAPLLERIYQALAPGGVLFVSDKLRLEGATTAPFMTELYHTFKQVQGYSRLEIERKRRALEEVLVPLSLAEELALLRGAGFADIEIVLKWNQFVSLVAIK
jgi:tRNA (cmo5U34)-methyltransferase